MNVVADRHDTSAFATHLGRSAVSAATIQDVDVFARDERQSTAFFSSQVTRPRRIDLHLQIRDRTASLTYLDFGSGLPAWATPVLRSLSERWGVNPGWDTYDAKPTDMGHVVRLLNYLSALMDDTSIPPIVTPLSDGGVQAEWHRNNKQLEVVVPADEPARYYYYDASTGEEEEQDLESNYARTQRLVEQL